MGRIIGIDCGRKRIGLAVTDPLGIFASPLETVNPAQFENFIDEYDKKEKIDGFVIGYPVTLNNTPSESVKYIDPFIRRLRKKYPDKTIKMVDERFTSGMALRAMIEAGAGKKERRNKSAIDKISAAIILQSFLDNKVNSNIKQ